jgi:hypothetical protein
MTIRRSLMKLPAALLVVVMSMAAPVSYGSDGGSTTRDDKKEQTQEKEKEKPKEKEKDDPNKGGAGVGPPTVHGCDSKGCGNNGPSTPKEPPKKCHKEKGIEICN